MRKNRYYVPNVKHRYRDSQRKQNSDRSKQNRK